jgi:hypothetical protein
MCADRFFEAELVLGGMSEFAPLYPLHGDTKSVLRGVGALEAGGMPLYPLSFATQIAVRSL